METRNTAAARKARFDKVIAEAKAKGEKIPESANLIQFRDPTPAEKARMDAVAKEIAPRLARVRNRSKAAA